jgi:hypothetical protein
MQMAEAVRGTDRLSRVRALLNQVNETRKAGHPELAYQYSLEASRIAPQDPEVWLARAETAPSIEEKLLCLSRLHTLSPYHPDAQRKTYSVLREMLYQEPFLAYLDETDHLYQVRNGPALAVTLPKYRAVPERYPPDRPKSIHRAYRFLALALLGLVPAGLGTLFLAPMAALTAFSAIGTKLDRKNSFRAASVIVLAAVLWLVAIPLVLILVLHLR